jgi:hypothetical protein
LNLAGRRRENKYFSNGVKKTKIIATIAVSFVVFATTFFALAQSQNTNSLFLDSDQDGLTDQEEKMIGTDPFKADTDGDGYSDGKEVGSGYDPLKPAPGDKLVPTVQSSSPTSNIQSSDSAQIAAADSISTNTAQTNDVAMNSAPDLSSVDPTSALAQLGQTDVLGTDAMTDLSSDPNNPNLTNEMIGQLMQLTTNKATTDTSFADNPTYTSSDIAQVTQGALQTVDLTKNIPDIKDSDINILPEVNDNNLSADDIKAKQKAQIEKYLSQSAFILASNSPFPVQNTSDLSSSLNTESSNFITALSTGDTSKLSAYAQKAQTGIDQMKKIEVPYVLKDIHKSALQLALYTLGLKDQISLTSADPMKSLAAASSLQAVAQKATDLQNQLSQILTAYGIDAVKFP